MKNYIYLLLFTVLLVGACKKTKNKKTDIGTIADPQKTTLVTPLKDEACLDANSVSATESKVRFAWKTTENTSSYELVIKNLLTSATINKTATTSSLEVPLTKNTPYSWYVISKSSATDKTSTSDIWKFYIPGSGTASYAPFPAEIVSPIMGLHYPATTSKITLQWKGKDVDNDIATYDIYLGTSPTLNIYKQGVSATSAENVSVTAQIHYYWKVVTKDSKGNTSESELYQFWVD